MKITHHSHKRLPKFEAFDQIDLAVIPRYKESISSGDEWRTSVRALFSFKGNLVHEQTYSSMQQAINGVGHEWALNQSPIPTRVLEIEVTRCDQPGCPNLAIPKLKHIREQFSSQGDKLDPSDQYGSYYRRFCKVHTKRGDCSREDCDNNYVEEEA